VFEASHPRTIAGILQNGAVSSRFFIVLTF
jgi:hypothetical protein